MNIKLQNELNIRRVAELKEQLSEALGAEGGIVLDATDVDATDTAGLQLLVALIQHASLKNKSVEWCHVTEEFLSAVKLMGLSESLNLDASV